MLTAPPERLVEALDLLDPTQRALLELSLHREVADPALAELLRTDADTVVQQRVDALQRVGDALDAPPAEVEDALIRHWRGEPEPEAEPPDEEPEPRDEEPEQSDEEAEPWTPADAVTAGQVERPRRRGLWAVVTALAAIGLVLVLVLGGGGDDGETEPGDGGPPPAELGQGGDPPPGQRGPEPVPLAALAGSRAGGTAQIVESDGARRLELRLRGLSEGSHAVWLYNSIGDARRLASARGPAPFVKAPLPDGYERYRYVDVSREPDDGNPNHSGESVLRIPTADLPGR